MERLTKWPVLVVTVINNVREKDNPVKSIIVYKEFVYKEMLVRKHETLTTTTAKKTGEDWQKETNYTDWRNEYREALRNMMPKNV